MKQIKLANNRGIALVDDNDFEETSEHKWVMSNEPNTNYALTWINIKGKFKTVSMHRLIMKAKKGQEVDHRDRNGLNNQKNNLRLCTRSQNLMNMKKRENCSSRYKGVTRSKSAKRWQAQITLNYRNINLGLFDSEIDAARAYNKAAIRLFGEFARLNNV